ncbi:MAG TPA: ankyrin repeat domain-containing protein [Frankiaceae bacterium]|jgi:ankyrin repeat protein|nr:ankyrin repeat domain-containing protein [Frankiaceae bacterium]
MAVSDLLDAVYRGDRAGRDAILRERAPADVFEAAAVGDVARLGELLDGDAALASATAEDGFTPLHLASFFGHADAVRALLARGAAVETVADNPMRVRPLHSAAASGDTEVVRLLVGAGANVNATQEGGYVPLHAVAQNGDAAAVDLLLDAGADPAARTEAGRSAADLANEAGHADLAARLEAASRR